MNAPLTYVLDTSVVLADPHSIFRFAEHHVVLPIVVITELEGKRHHSELVFCETLWPDFTRGDFDAAIDEYASRERRFGA